MILALGQAKAGDAARGKSISFWKVYVEEYSVGARPGYGGKCFVTVRGLFDEFEAACGEQFSRPARNFWPSSTIRIRLAYLTHSW
jgi:hypothetical protein